MRYVERDENGVIKGDYAQRQEGVPEELVDDDNPELLAFYASQEATPAPSPMKQLADLLVSKGMLSESEATTFEQGPLK